MAQASDIDDLLQCPICLELFHDPKVLDCQHTFCSYCLKVHWQSTSSRLLLANSIECPLCRRRTNLLNNSIDSLPGNYIVRDIIERKCGTNEANHSSNNSQRIRDRLKKMENEQNDSSEDKGDADYMNYVKPAAAALIGVLGGLLIAKGAKKLKEKSKRQGGH